MKYLTSLKRNSSPSLATRQLLPYMDLEVSGKPSLRRPSGRSLLQTLTGQSKSQIALEYAYRLREQSPQCSIFWVYATNVTKFEEGYKRIASECHIPGCEDPKGDLMQLIRNWLESKYKCNWLMIIDNVDDVNIFFKEKNTFEKSL